MNVIYNEVNEIRDLSINEIEEVGGGDGCSNLSYATNFSYAAAGFMALGSFVNPGFAMGALALGAVGAAGGLAQSYFC